MRGDAGSSMVLIAGLLGVVVAVSVAAAGLGLAYSARAQAQVASDAAALAAAVGTYPPAASDAPLELARRIAIANRARVVSCSCPVDSSMRPRVVTVVAVVSIDAPVFGHLDIEASSRAEFDPRRWLGR